MFTRQTLENVLFLDIETVSVQPRYVELSEQMRKLWDKKATIFQRSAPEKSSVELFGEKAGIYAEFGKVVCISCGYLMFDPTGKPQIKMKSFCGPDEPTLLANFGDMLNKYIDKKAGRTLCAHNGKEFDFPFLGRRYLINYLPIPKVLQTQGKKPWELSFIDTMELWKFGDYKAYTSLELMATVLGIPSPKDDIDGSQVSRVFWEDADYERIQVYCEKDVKTTAQVLLRMSRMPLID